MTRFLALAAATVSILTLTACFEGSKNGSTPLTTSSYNFSAVQGQFTDNAAHAVLSTDDQENPNNTRFTAQFTAGGDLVVVDTAANGGAGQTYTFTETELQNSFGDLAFMKTFASQIDNGGGTNFMGDPGFEQVYVITPTNTNSNEYALMRLGSTDNGTQWLFAGEPTSTPLTGTASYSGGAYLSSVTGSAGGHAAMTMDADFSGAADAIDVTLAHAYDPTDTTMFGAQTIGFKADFDNSTNTISATNKAITDPGSLYDTANLEGGFFYSGANAAGLMNLSDTTNTNADIYGGFSVERD